MCATKITSADAAYYARAWRSTKSRSLDEDTRNALYTWVRLSTPGQLLALLTPLSEDELKELCEAAGRKAAS